MAVKAVLMDFGNVIGWFDYQIAYDAIAKLGDSTTPSQVKDVLIGMRLIEQLESGDITSAQFLEKIRKSFGLTKAADEDLADTWSNIFTRNEPVINAIKEIPPRIRVILASNTNELHFNHFFRQFSDVFERFSAFVCSYEIKKMKPAREFYQICLTEAQCEAQECLYFDDTPSYVKAAQSLGIQGVVYTRDVDIQSELVKRQVS